MSLDIKVHSAQTAVLRELLFHKQAGFAQMQKPTGLTSDHFNFHISKLLELGLVEKLARGKYRLSHKGKEYANKMDTDSNTVERQPKVAVCLMIRRDDGLELLQQRLKQPYYGYWGRPTGKIRWGETILEAAARELLEETGLKADLAFEEVHHKQDFNHETGEMLEDKIFFVVAGSNPRGSLINEFEGGRNTWMSMQEYSAQPLNFARAAEILRDPEVKITQVGVLETKHHYSPEQY